MKNVRVCPKCKKLVYFNSYFGAYICEYCGWEDDSYAKERDSYVTTAKSQMFIKVPSRSGTVASFKPHKKSMVVQRKKSITR